MTREVKNGKVAFKGGQCGIMDDHSKYLAIYRKIVLISS